MRIGITLERRTTCYQEFDVTAEELMRLKNGDNPFMDQMLKNMDDDSSEYDYAVDDENGKTIVGWC